MPVNIETEMFIPSEKGPNCYVMQNGEIKRGFKVNSEREGIEFGYTSHFATCTSGEKFRKSRSERR